MALSGIQIFKMTPKKNCKECGCPTCMAFSMKVAQGAMDISACPYMSDDAMAQLSEATAPPNEDHQKSEPATVSTPLAERRFSIVMRKHL